jgi:hypothetical protein
MRNISVDLHAGGQNHCVFSKTRDTEMRHRVSALLQPPAAFSSVCQRRWLPHLVRTRPDGPAQGTQPPQLGMNTITTRSPGFKSLTLWLAFNDLAKFPWLPVKHHGHRARPVTRK